MKFNKIENLLIDFNKIICVYFDDDEFTITIVADGFNREMSLCYENNVDSYYCDKRLLVRELLKDSEV